MEGVLVSAKKAGSTMTITVVSDEQGRYRFPSSKLPPGQYALRIRAVGYDLESPSMIEVGTGNTAIADLKLRKAADPAAQLSNAEWFASLPGTEQQKASVRNCRHCHTLERIMRSRADADAMAKVVERMSTYPQLSFPLMPQKLVAARDRRRRGSAGAKAGRLAAAGAVSEHGQSEFHGPLEVSV